MSRYAKGTLVSIERSRAEIERTLHQYGADDVLGGQSNQHKQALVQFRYRGLSLEIRLALPEPTDPKFAVIGCRGGSRKRTESGRLREWEQACRQQWRIVLLLIKANLEAVEGGVLSPQNAFLPWLLLPNGQTLGRALAPGLDKIIASGELSKLLSFGKK